MTKKTAFGTDLKKFGDLDFRLTIDSLPEVVTLYNADLQIIYVNRSGLKLFGRPLSDFIGKRDDEVWPREVYDHFMPSLLKAARTKTKQSLEMSLTFPNGQSYSQAVIYQPILDDQGNLQRLVGITFDITERKRSEENMRFLLELKARLRIMTDVDRVMEETVRSLGEYLNVARCGFTEVYEDGVQVLIRQDWCRGVPSIKGTHRISNFITPKLREVLLRGEPLAINDVHTHELTAPFVDNYNRAGIVAYITVPWINEGRWRALLDVHMSEPRTWRNDEIMLLQEVVAQVWPLVENAWSVRALRQSEVIAQQQLAEIESIYHSVHVGLCVFDRQLRFIRINKRLAEINGVPAENHIGKTPGEVVPALAETAEQLANKIFETGEPILNIQLSGTTPAQPDVQRHWIEHWLPLKNKQGNVEGISVVVEEITELIQSKEALRKKEQHLSVELEASRLLHEFSTKLIQAGNVEAISDQILATLLKILRSDYATLQLFHPERGAEGELYLLSHKGFGEFDTKCWEWITPHSRSSCGLALQSWQRVAIPDVLQWDYIAGSSALEQYLQAGIRAVQTTPLLSSTGNLLGMFSSHWRQPHELTETETRCLDVLARQAADLIERTQSEKKLQEREESYRILSEQLREADRLKDEFLGMLSHEIRNPIASIMLCLPLLDRAEPGSEQATRAIEIMNRQTAQLSRLVDDLLDVTRITRGKIELKKENVELNTLVLRTAEDYRSLYQDKGVALDISPALPALYVEADPARLSQVVGNLLHNAYKFTESGGYTRVSVFQEGLEPQAVIQVEDNGIGMTPEMMLENIFTPFVQAETSLDRNGSNGLGLGLALVKELTELHGGTVSVHSGGLGKGATFTVRLHLSAGPFPAQADEVSAAVACRNLRVLVIEDIKDMANSIKSLLEGEGHDVMVAYDGFKGIVKAKEFHPDVLLCDIGLPSMDGYQVARVFHTDEDLKQVYLVSLTGYARPEDIKKAKEAGFHHQLAKPVILEKIRRVFEYYTTSFSCSNR